MRLSRDMYWNTDVVDKTRIKRYDFQLITPFLLITSTSKVMKYNLIRLLPLFLLPGCTHYYYAPNMLHAPALRKQHDARISLGVGGGDEYTADEFQAVYSPIKYGAVMFNRMSAQGGSENTSHGYGNLTEGALGGYLPSGNRGNFSLFGGYGQGRVRNWYLRNDGTTELTYESVLRFQRYFIQPSFAYQSKWFRFGAGYRFVWLKYLDGDVDYRIQQSELDAIRLIEQRSPVFLPELGLHLGVHLGPTVFSFHTIISNSQTTNADMHLNKSNTGISLSLNLNELWQKTKVPSSSVRPPSERME